MTTYEPEEVSEPHKPTKMCEERERSWREGRVNEGGLPCARAQRNNERETFTTRGWLVKWQCPFVVGEESCEGSLKIRSNIFYRKKRGSCINTPTQAGRAPQRFAALMVSRLFPHDFQENLSKYKL